MDLIRSDSSHQKSMFLIGCCFVVVILAVACTYSLAHLTLTELFAKFESVLMFLTANFMYIVIIVVCYLIYKFYVKRLAHIDENNEKERQHQKDLLQMKHKQQCQILALEQENQPFYFFTRWFRSKPTADVQAIASK